jgi:hypothetical protein
LINLGEGVQPKTYFRYALVKRLEGRQLYPHYLPVDLGHALDAPRSGPDPVSRCSIPSQYTIRTICGTSPQYQLRGRFVFLEHINLTQT